MLKLNMTRRQKIKRRHAKQAIEAPKATDAPYAELASKSCENSISDNETMSGIEENPTTASSIYAIVARLRPSCPCVFAPVVELALSVAIAQFYHFIRLISSTFTVERLR